MKFASSYEPNQYESDIYAAWEAAGVFQPATPTVPIDNDGNGVDDRFESRQHTYSLVMPPPNANGNLHIGHGLTIALEDSLTRYHRLKQDSTWYIPGADHAGFETWVVYERTLEKDGHTRFEYEVLGHVLAGHTVAAGGTAHEHAVPILTGNGETVELRLNDVDRMRHDLPHTAVEIADLIR